MKIPAGISTRRMLVAFLISVVPWFTFGVSIPYLEWKPYAQYMMEWQFQVMVWVCVPIYFVIELINDNVALQDSHWIPRYALRAWTWISALNVLYWYLLLSAIASVVSRFRAREGENGEAA